MTGLRTEAAASQLAPVVEAAPGVEAAPPATAQASGVAPRHGALASLTGLRFFAAFAVFCFHVTLSNSPIPPNDPINPFRDTRVGDALATIASKGGYIGVSFFFVLSGFVLAWSYRPGEPHRSFWRRRLTKVFPNHLVMWALALILFAAGINSVTGILTNLVLASAYVPDASVYDAVNPPSWTLCSELLFYLLFPYVFGLILRIRPERLWAWVVVTLLGALAVALVTQYVIPTTPKSPITPVSSLQFWFGYTLPVTRLFEFVLGSLLARLVLHGFRPRVPLWAAAALCAASYVLAMHLPFVYSFFVVTLVPVGLLITVAAARDADGRTSWLGSRTMVWLGNVSFGFYIVQGVTIFYVRQVMHSDTYSTVAAAGVVIALFVLTLAAGAALHHLVEMPAMRRWARPVRRVDAAVGAR